MAKETEKQTGPLADPIPRVEDTPPATIKKEAPRTDPGVTLSTEAFNALMARLSSLEDTTKAMFDVQDKSKLLKIEQMRRDGKLVKDIKLRVLEGKVVVGWKTVQDEVYFADGKLIENQKVAVYLEDKTQKELSMRQWASLPAYQAFEVVKESRSENGQIFYTVRREDGRELEIDITYIN